MAVLDRVIGKPLLAGNARGGFTNPPLVGTLLSAADPSVIQWENGEQSSQPVNDTLLLKVLDPNPEAAQLVGQWLQIRSLPASVAGADGGPPKSPGASGICVRALGLGDTGSTVVDATLLVIAQANGVEVAGFYIADDPDNDIFGGFVANPGRRSVASN